MNTGAGLFDESEWDTMRRARETAGAGLFDESEWDTMRRARAVTGPKRPRAPDADAADDPEFKDAFEFGEDYETRALDAGGSTRPLAIADAPPGESRESRAKREGTLDKIRNVIKKGLTYVTYLNPRAVKTNFFGMDDEATAKLYESDPDTREKLFQIIDEWGRLKGDEPPDVKRGYIDAVSGSDPLMKVLNTVDLVMRNALSQVEKTSRTIRDDVSRAYMTQLKSTRSKIENAFTQLIRALFFIAMLGLSLYTFRQMTLQKMSQKRTRTRNRMKQKRKNGVALPLPPESRSRSRPRLKKNMSLRRL